MMSVERDQERVNFRCSRRLRNTLAEAAKRSGVGLSEQIRVTLEKVYEVEPEEYIWLPPILQEATVPPTPGAPAKKKS